MQSLAGVSNTLKKKKRKKKRPLGLVWELKQNREPFLAIVCEFQREQNTEKRELQREVQFEKDREKHSESVRE